MHIEECRVRSHGWRREVSHLFETNLYTSPGEATETILTPSTALNQSLNTTVLHNLTYTLVLHPIAGFFAFLSLLMGLLGACAASRIATIFMALFAGFAGFLALVIFVIDMVLWNITKNTITSNGGMATLVSPIPSTSALLWLSTSNCGATLRCRASRTGSPPAPLSRASWRSAPQSAAHAADSPLAEWPARR